MTGEAHNIGLPSQLTRPEAILEIAADLFRLQGYEGTSVDEIARLASTSKATIYKYFKSKTGLFEHVLARETEIVSLRLIGNLERTDDFKDNLTALAESLLEIITSERYLQTRNLFASTAHGIKFGSGWHENVYAPFLERLGATLEKRMQLGQLLEEDPIQAADTFVALVYGTTVELMALGARQQPTPEEQKELANIAVIQFLRCYNPANAG